MTDIVTQEPGSSDRRPNIMDECDPICIRTMTNSKTDCQFLAEMKVEADRDKYIHATSKGSLSTITWIMSRNHEEQQSWFYDRNFIADYNNEPTGILSVVFPGDPDPIQMDLDTEFGCTEQCGLCCLKRGLDETVPEGNMYIKHLYVLESFRNKGIGEKLLDKAESEAKTRNISVMFLYVSFGNRAKHLYLRRGYNVVSQTWCCLWCAMGSCCFYKMEKRVP